MDDLMTQLGDSPWLKLGVVGASLFFVIAVLDRVITLVRLGLRLGLRFKDRLVNGNHKNAKQGNPNQNSNRHCAFSDACAARHDALKDLIRSVDKSITSVDRHITAQTEHLTRLSRDVIEVKAKVCQRQ